MAELTDYTGYLLRTAFVRAASLVPKTFPAGEHPRDAGVLSTLEAVGPCSQQQLVDALHVNRSMMVKLIDGLEARGLVERRRNPDDRRSYALYPTTAGRKALAAMMPLMDSGEAALSATLTAAERDRLIELLHALVQPPDSAMARRLGFLIAQAHHRFRLRADQILRPLGIEIRHFGALTALADGVPSQRELADRLRVSGPVVVEMVDALEARGLVERRRDPADRRSNALVVTASGREALERARGPLDAATSELVAPIGADGDAELRALLRKLLQI
jgi:DNA-binding MarR family transcriptional regulator